MKIVTTILKNTDPGRGKVFKLIEAAGGGEVTSGTDDQLSDLCLVFKRCIERWVGCAPSLAQENDLHCLISLTSFLHVSADP